VNSPVVFQDLEDELRPVVKHLKGKVLNAGCGNRDISLFLIAGGATEVEGCDRASSIPNAIICDLGSIPRPNDTYDSILCNAVLEHVQFPDQVLRELYRVLNPGGTMVLCVPFLQPYHPAPDYRRYTREGMLELARIYDMELIEILPVHTIAQTITWIGWSYVEEQRKRFLQAALWLPFYLWNQLSKRTDHRILHQANGYQMVLRKVARKNGHATA
jgi:ubiquinone/menaquinone biosynthesis C-methylase UbiE